MIEIGISATPAIADIIALYREAGLKRPIDDPDRIAAVYQASDLVVTARRHGELVGIARALTDDRYVCYLADLAVSPTVQKQGIGRALIAHLAGQLGPEVSIVLLSAPGATGFYDECGFARSALAFVRARAR